MHAILYMNTGKLRQPHIVFAALLLEESGWQIVMLTMPLLEQNDKNE